LSAHTADLWLLQNDSVTIPIRCAGCPRSLQSKLPHKGVFLWVLRGMPYGFENESPHKGT